MYTPAADRYDRMPMRRAGRSGLDLPAISLGLWQNFGDNTPLQRQRDIILHAIDQGITQIDLANNYGPPPGSAERNFARVLHSDLAGLRDQLVVTTKAGYDMWPGPYGQWGSRKYLLASLDASLDRLGLPYVDIFYSHRFDPNTPLRETMGALKTAVDSGRALYAGISSYSATRTREALAVCADIGLDLLVHQPSYSMLNRWIEEPDTSGESVLDVLGSAGMGSVVFSPLAQGLLTGKYLHGVPEGSRAARHGSLRSEHLSEQNLTAIRSLHEVAQARGQSLAQMAIAWVLRDPRVTTALVGASSVEQLSDTLGALANLDFTADELERIDRFARDGDINIWARSSDA
ncbi:MULTISPECIES: L-glyceraldehyde 3-phosphate reductase [unclassified Pseudactinotalea]|uniref:L-glyceraldehyde 3-phosphate reductase n=1 Tax=unclassified Pseudactinotalea TaxID=2649176 RepID=UPI00128BD644|nr:MULTISPECIES: L-glyceraldehyde 3-phosphate reductase [unclassified Pseudactinotalea]MPV49539.1 L-glyceraldehyde 3-phosphate reductase [Pseudactinotalea sp. HY160]QGH69846.1 L-glyceraldehyde 3-phosphate reductase [Pseudactinotalea sp. HY158]